MKSDTTIVLTPLDNKGQALTPFIFSNAEVPQKIAFGGDQMLAVHQKIGGGRTIDAMGPAYMPLSWGGIFQGAQALPRARYLDYIRSQGNKCLLTWSELSYSVVIQTFTADFERFYQLPYQISCLVESDNAKPQLSAPYTTDQAIGDDINSAFGLGDLIGDSILTDGLNSLQSAISAITTFAGAAQSTILTVLTPIQAVQDRVSTLIASTGNALINVSTLGGVLPGNPISQQVSGLLSATVNMQQQPILYQLQSIMGRMTTNLGNVNSTGATVTQSGGNLYQLSQTAYGDATDWTSIAQANNLVDPSLVGNNTLIIPSAAVSSGGILQP